MKIVLWFHLVTPVQTRHLEFLAGVNLGLSFSAFYMVKTDKTTMDHHKSEKKKIEEAWSGKYNF